MMEKRCLEERFRRPNREKYEAWNVKNIRDEGE